MPESRRVFVNTTVASSIILFAGCSSDGTGSNFPDPEVISTTFPEPQAVSTDSTRISGNTYEFSVTVENTGDPGDVIITLHWLDQDGDPSEAVASIERYYRAEERREETITAQRPEFVSRFNFDLISASITATVQNNGGPGAVTVELYNSLGDNSMVLGSTTVEMEASETQEVELSSEEITAELFLDDNTEIRAVSGE